MSMSTGNLKSQYHPSSANEKESTPISAEVIPEQDLNSPRPESRSGSVDELHENKKEKPKDGIVLGSLHVAELDMRVEEQILLEYFSMPKDCHVTSVKLVRDKFTRQSLGYAYVNFENEEQAKRALNELNFTKLAGRVIRISLTKERLYAFKQKRNNKANLYVKNLDLSIDSRSLYIAFKEYGPITSVRVIEHFDGRSKGFGFVCFEEEDDALKAMEHMDNVDLKGKKIHVSIALCQSHDEEDSGQNKKIQRNNTNTSSLYPPYWGPVYYLPMESEYMPVSYLPQNSFIHPMNSMPFVPVYPYPTTLPFPQKQDDSNKMNQTVQMMEKLKL